MLILCFELETGILAGRCESLRLHGRIRMQARGITGGITLGTACYWGSKQQYLYFWDELLWICGFFVIENNLIAQRVRLRTGFGSSSAA